jgi:hypothetical protein
MSKRNHSCLFSCRPPAGQPRCAYGTKSDTAEFGLRLRSSQPPEGDDHAAQPPPRTPCHHPCRRPVGTAARGLLQPAALGLPRARPAGGRIGLQRETRLGQRALRRGRSQPAGHRCGLPGAVRRRLGTGCGHRRADGAGAGGAAVQRHRRRRLPAARGGPQGAGLRWARDRSHRRHGTPLPRHRGPAHAVPRRGGGRPRRGRARRRAHAGAGAQGAWQAGLGHAVRAGHPPGGTRLQGQRPAACAALQRKAPGRRSGGARLFLRRRGCALARGPHAEEPRTGRRAARHRATAPRPCWRATWHRPSWTR